MDRRNIEGWEESWHGREDGDLQRSGMLGLLKCPSFVCLLTNTELIGGLLMYIRIHEHTKQNFINPLSPNSLPML